MHFYYTEVVYMYVSVVHKDTVVLSHISLSGASSSAALCVCVFFFNTDKRFVLLQSVRQTCKLVEHVFPGALVRLQMNRLHLCSGFTSTSTWLYQLPQRSGNLMQFHNVGGKK